METETETVVKPTTDMNALAKQNPGSFFESLNRNNKQLRADRAQAITQNAKVRYRRLMEDLEMELQQLEWDRAALLDLNQKDRNTLVTISDFEADDFVTKDIELGVKKRNLQIKLDIVRKQYHELFEGV